jgi:hypothetical protein
LLQGNFVNHLINIHGVVIPKETGENLDIEDPTRAERLFEEPLHIGVHAEKLGPALSVIDRYTQLQGHRGGKAPTQVVSEGAALDPPTQKLDASPEGHQGFWVRVKVVREFQDLGQRRREVGVPEPDVREPQSSTVKNATSNRFGLAAVSLQVQNQETINSLPHQAVQQFLGTVCAPVVHEEEGDIRRLVDKLKEDTRIYSLSFVEAGHDDRAPQHCRYLLALRTRCLDHSSFLK